MIDRRRFVSLLGAVLALPSISAHAQTPAAIPNEADLVGLQAAVWRSYAPAGTFVGQGTIDLDEATPESSPEAASPLRSIEIVVREFDSADNAALAFERISATVEASMPGVFSDGTQKMTSETLPDIGSQATLFRIEHAGQGSDVWLESAVVQRDQYVFFVSATASTFTNMGSNPDNTSLPTAEIAAAVASGEPSPDEPAFRDDGTSTGGLWGFMIPPGDPLLVGLVPVGDNIMYPNPGS